MDVFVLVVIRYIRYYIFYPQLCRVGLSQSKNKQKYSALLRLRKSVYAKTLNLLKNNFCPKKSLLNYTKQLKVIGVSELSLLDKLLVTI